MKYSELKNACKQAATMVIAIDAIACEQPLSNKWRVRVQRIPYRNIVTFHLISPTFTQHGGEEKLSKFVPWAMRFMQ